MNGKNISQKSKLVGVLSVLCVALTVLAVINSVKIKDLQRDKEVQAQKCLSELCESLDSITVSLQKSLYTGTGEKLAENGNDLCREASVAKVSLSGLTDEDMITDEIYKFLSQVGDYTLSLCRKDRFSVTDEERKQIEALYEYSKTLSGALEQISQDYYDGSVTFSEKFDNLMKDTELEQISFSHSFTDTQQTMTDYPTLLYDGPFADAVINKIPKGLQGGEITSEEAKKKAAEIFGCDPSSLKHEADVDSQISLYCFSSADKSIGITKTGGYVCYITDSSYAGEAAISYREAVKRGKEFLKKTGFEEKMTETYYSTYDGICTVNYAYENEGIIYYADLIKVSISLETGKAVALDSRGYLMNHGQRKSATEKLSMKECRNVVSDYLNVKSSRKAVIPLETGKEALCYEFHCSDKKGQEVLVYIDARTGEERDIMLLLYSDDGVLAK